MRRVENMFAAPNEPFCPITKLPPNRLLPDIPLTLRSGAKRR